MTPEQVKEAADRSWGHYKPPVCVFCQAIDSAIGERCPHCGNSQPRPCVVCGTPTLAVLNINLHKTHVCDSCCLSISCQTVSSLTVVSNPNRHCQTYITAKDRG